MKKFKWIVEITVDETWVADGFDLTNENINERLAAMLPFAYGYEFSGKVIKSPIASAIGVAQGTNKEEQTP